MGIEKMPTGKEGRRIEEETCPRCRGSGKTSTDENCATCRGTGKLRSEH